MQQTTTIWAGFKGTLDSPIEVSLTVTFEPLDPIGDRPDMYRLQLFEHPGGAAEELTIPREAAIALYGYLGQALNATEPEGLHHPGVEITKERIGKYDFYRATFNGKSYGPSTLTNLCAKIKGWLDVNPPT